MEAESRSSGMSACIFCRKTIRNAGMRRHQNSESCKAAQSRKMIPKDWIRLDYNLRPHLYKLVSVWDRVKDMPHIKEFTTGYRKPGWGRRGRKIVDTYLDPRLVDILISTHLSDDEKKLCLSLPPEHEQFRASWATALLAGNT